MAINPEDLIDPIRYYKPNDPYYYEVDNLPLEDLLENDRRLLQAITSIVASIPNNIAEGDTFATQDWVSNVATGPFKRVLADLDDVTAPGPIADQVLTYSTAGWEPKTPVVSLEGLSDTDLEGTAEGDLMRYNGASWVNVSSEDIHPKGQLVRVPTTKFSRNFNQLLAADQLFGDVPVDGAGDFKIELADYWSFSFDATTYGDAWYISYWINHEFLNIYAVLSPNLILHPDVGSQTLDWSLNIDGEVDSNSYNVDTEFRFARQSTSHVNRSGAQIYMGHDSGSGADHPRFTIYFPFANQSASHQVIGNRKLQVGLLDWTRYGTPESTTMKLWLRKTDNEPASVKFYVGMNWDQPYEGFNNGAHNSLNNEYYKNAGMITCTPISHI